MDFYRIVTKKLKDATYEVYPDFIIGRSKDLMVRGRSFYAIWDEKQKIWSTDEFDVQRLVDETLAAAGEEAREQYGTEVEVKYMSSMNSNSWMRYRQMISNISDNSHPLDESLTFANDDVKKSDFVSRRLSYPLEPGDYGAWDELVGTLYSVEERAKIEWMIGAIVSGDSKTIQKFLVFYGPAGTGKSTILNIIEMLFKGYTTTFEAKALGSSNGTFATEVFKGNPLVAIQHDGDLSRIEDNTKLNSIISHEEMTMNEKHKPSYTAKVNAILLMGTNQPVKISDAKSGIIRRLIDVHPTGVKIPANHYYTLMQRVEFELGAIAHHCREVYFSMGKNYYNSYRPLEMMLQTDVFFNYIEANYDLFKQQDGTSLKQAYSLYKEFCSETGIDRILPQYKVREELRNYFDEFKERHMVNGQVSRSIYVGFNANKFKSPAKDSNTFSLVMDETESIFDQQFSDCPAQGATPHETPKQPWASVKTKLSDIDTSTIHFVRVPLQHIVIDFDLKDESGEKSLEKNLEAASVWPATYGELSKSGGGVHLHYEYEGDVTQLASKYSDGIEVKVFTGNSSLRRALTKCNNVPIATLNSGLPLKEKKVLTEAKIKTEKGLRDMITRNLRKEFHAGTKPSIDFIHKILDDAYSAGVDYDVTDMRPTILAFANNSSNQPMMCLKTVQKMRFQGPESAKAEADKPSDEVGQVAAAVKDGRNTFFDVEVYPNLFVICWKFEDDPVVVKMINPSAQDVEALFSLKLIGYNNRRYDNHILYARHLGYDNESLYKLSQKIIDNDRSASFGEAYNLSYADIYDFSSKKQTLKKFQIELGIEHKEMDIPWDQPVPDDMINKVVEYCVNDVVTTEAVFKSRKQDFIARQILADVSGLSVNDTTQRHTAKIIFEGDKRAHEQFVYTDLSVQFPGYTFDMGKSLYKGEDPSEGGYVYSEPGMYDNVAVLDVVSMHPASIENLKLFGKYTKNFSDLKNARVAIKQRKYDQAKKMLGGKLAPYLASEDEAEALSYALKIVINIVYGLTSAKFDNPFRDIRNKDNIVAKRGALFMIDLKEAVQEQGFTVAHIKTDSIKIPNATPDIIHFVHAFGKKYGYDFEHETTYDKFCLVNDAVYIAREGNNWDAVGAQFQHPYVYKSLFTGEDLTFDDMCETKQVTRGSMYLDFSVEDPMIEDDGSKMKFVGRTGRFTPVLPGEGGGTLWRVNEDKRYAVTGTKNYLWMESHMAKDQEAEIDLGYFDEMVNNARKTIEKFGSFDDLVAQ